MTKRIVFLDTETTGLDPMRHEVISVGCVVTDMSLEVLGTREWLVQPNRIEDADPKALEINGYDHLRWVLDGRPKTPAMGEIRVMLSGCMIAGHNVEFDRRFICAELDRLWIPHPRWHYASLDTGSMAFPLLQRGEVPNLKLDTLTAHFGIDYGTPHRALNDAMRSLLVARELIKRFAP